MMGPAIEGITCRELVELVSAYLEGSLSAGDRKRFEDHLGICEACATFVEQERMTIAAAGAIGEEDLDPAAREAMLRTFRDWKRER